MDTAKTEKRKLSRLKNVIAGKRKNNCLFSVYYNTKHKNEMLLQIKLFRVLTDNIKRFFRFSGYTVTVLQATLLYGLTIN